MYVEEGTHQYRVTLGLLSGHWRPVRKGVREVTGERAASARGNEGSNILFSLAVVDVDPVEELLAPSFSDGVLSLVYEADGQTARGLEARRLSVETIRRGIPGPQE